MNAGRQSRLAQKSSLVSCLALYSQDDAHSFDAACRQIAARRPPGLLRACRAPASSGVVIGPRYGEDAAVIDMGEKYLVAKTDPITFTEERIGWYAVHINANDIATLGARPRWFLATLLLPEGRATRELARRIFRDILRTCRSLGIALVRRPHRNHRRIAASHRRGPDAGGGGKIRVDSQREPAARRPHHPDARRGD